MRRFSVLTAVVLAAGVFMVSDLSFADAVQATKTNIADKGNSSMTKAELERRGKELRAAIDQKYKELIDTKTFVNDPTKGNDITVVVLKYIPIGMSFDNGETILRAAGMNVGQHPDINLPDNGPATYAVWASALLLQELGCQTSSSVFLYPSIPGKYDKIKKVDAGILKMCL